MKIFPYPGYTRKEILVIFAIHVIMFTSFVKIADFTLMSFVTVIWLVVIVSDLFELFRRRFRWIAKIEGGLIYFLTERNQVSLSDVVAIRRQEVAGTKHGIDIMYNDGQVHSMNLPMLNTEQTDTLVDFLNGKQI